MPSFSHNKIIKEIQKLDTLPADNTALAEWVLAKEHLEFLKKNAQSDEIVIYASGPYSFINTVIVPNDFLFPLNKDDLLYWNGNPYSSVASYVYGGGRQDVWIENCTPISGSEVLRQGKDLIFARTFEGWTGAGRTYFEIPQEYGHLADIHWRPEYSSYCRFDENGDLAHLVSITTNETSTVSLTSFSWPKLEEYLTISKSSLVRMFDFTLLRRRNFLGWGDGSETNFYESDELFYRQKSLGLAAYSKGIQIIKPRRPKEIIYNDFTGGWLSPKDREYAEFLAQDWRNQCIAKISTSPNATVNYFNMADSNLPHELSIAYFRPEVLSKYKTDREKYKIEARSITCRTAWYLKGYDVNEAGQVHAYICDLRNLPYSEQLHWLGHNEAPKAGISERAFINDFKGEFVTFEYPRDKIMSIVRTWDEKGIQWWKLKDPELLHRANHPLTSSRDEWADAFMDISQLLMEGFDVQELRKMLESQAIPYGKDDKSLVLIEKLIVHSTGSESPIRLEGLRKAQLIRSKVKGHAGSSEGRQLGEQALSEHGSFAKHFEHTCKLIAEELQNIQSVCNRYKIPKCDPEI